MLIGEICTRRVVTCNRDTNALQAAQIMRSSHVGDLVVVIKQPNGKRMPVGIVTDRDLVVAVMATEVDPACLTADDIMRLELVTATENDTVYDTIAHMRKNGVRRIPVVDERGALVGIVTADDLLEHMAEEIAELARVPSGERLQEERIRK
ncbi:MAG: CBS domain-containing protein [Burkholderiales bacterium]